MIPAARIIPLFVGIPLAAAFLISLFGKRIKKLPDAFAALTGLSLCGLSILAVWLYNIHGVLTYSVGGWRPPIGIGLVLDGLTAFMLVTVNLVAFVVVVYALNYMERFTAKWKFYTLFFLMLAGMNGVVITGDMFNLFVFLEIAAVASYALVAFGTERHELEAAFKYAIMGTVGASFILLGIGFLYAYTSTLNMADMGAVLAQKGIGSLGIIVSAMFLMGFGLKAALVPFHAWLPDAHPSAPAPISAMLSGVLIKSLGIYTLCRIFYNVIGMSLQLSSILMFLGVLSMVVGGLLALGQWDFKRLLAYSSISQVGYIILGIGLGTPLGILGGLFHLFNHSIFKSLLFLNSGAVEYATGTRDLQKMGGLVKKMPVTGTTALLGSMSIAGIPPFNGFWSKLLIIIAAVEAGRFGYAFWAVLISILTLAMYMKVMKYAFFGNLKDNLNKIQEVPVFMKLSMGTLAFICLVGGVLFLPGVYRVFLQSAQIALLQGTKYATVVLQGIR
ncbi:MAG: monovalent cation/H+ antiporter subunit D family protein [Candidatus Omnitrophica bacterium]|nr:monovalent cation/H+ antiporter subunit D family protein [Candidatus Omnitrophota bacterium]